MNELKLILKSLVVSTQQLTVRELERDYYHQVGTGIPYKEMGFHTTFQLLSSMEDFKLYGKGANALVTCTSSKKSQHIQQLVQEQKRARPRQQEMKGFGHSPFPPFKGSFGGDNMPNFNTARQAMPQRDNNFQGFQHSFGNPHYKEKTMAAQYKFPVPNEKKQLTSCNSKTGASSSPHAPRSELQVNSDAKPGREAAASLANVNPTVRNESKNTSTDLSTSKRPLDVNQMNSDAKPSNEPTASFADLSPVRNETVNVSTDSSKSKALRTDNQKNPDAASSKEAIPSFAIDENVLSIGLTEPIASLGDDFPEAELSLIDENCVLNIFVSEVYGLDKFWFHNCATLPTLKKCMEKLKLFYEDRDNSVMYSLPESAIAPGRICVAAFNGIWHRARILTNVIRDHAKVNFVDFATVDYVHVRDLKHITVNFTRFPVQVLRGSLGNVKPSSPTKELEASLEFLSMIAEKPMHARVLKIDAVDRLCYVELSETPEEFRAIDSTLFSKGLAISAAGSYCHHKNYPSFEMLEWGKYPTQAGINSFLTKYIKYNENIENKVLEMNASHKDSVYKHILRSLPIELLRYNPFKLDILAALEKD